MTWLIGILLFLLALSFIPIRINVQLVYRNKSLYLKIFKFKYNLLEKLKERKEVCPKKKKTRKKLDYENLLKLIKIIDNNKFKPKIKTNINLEYGLEEAHITGIAYGVVSSFSPVFFRGLSVFFNIKKYEWNIKPEYNSFTFGAEFTSIISISLAKIIYMSGIIVKSMKFNKLNLFKST